MSSLAPSRTLVVAAASRHAGTDEIADRLAWVLENDLRPGWRVLRRDVLDLQALDDADAVVLGSAIYFGYWLKPAARALAYLNDAANVDLWMFSSGPVSEHESENGQAIAANSLVGSRLAIEHKVFGGRLDTSRLTLLERTALRAVRAKPGDYRDWDEIDTWGHRIADKLKLVAV
ncbi:MAG: flavodoxin domain-containing protein [Aeromicrobium sp.]